MKELEHTHDLRLPDWGPYTKKYIGISHIADRERGLRYDLSVFPGLYRRKVDVPSVTWESGYHPWKAAPDLSSYTFRHELEWQDQVYADITYSTISEMARGIRCELVNHTAEPQNLVLHMMSSLHYPQVAGHGATLEVCAPKLPDGAVWKDALDYDDLQFSQPRPSDHLVYDGWHRGEIRGQHYVGGSGLGRGFGAQAGDHATYTIALDRVYEAARLVIRYRMDKAATTKLRFTGDAFDEMASFVGTGELHEMTISIGGIGADRFSFAIQAAGGSEIELDGFVLVEQDMLQQVRFEPIANAIAPQWIEGPVPGSMILKYDACEHYYGLRWEYEQYEIRAFHTSELDRFMRHYVHDHVKNDLHGDGEGHYTNVFLRPILLSPQSQVTITGMVCAGALHEIESMLLAYLPDPDSASGGLSPARDDDHPAGADYQLGQQLLAATLLTNVVYPVYTKRSYIRHYTPGRWWDSLYTWDSGFIGLGLLELDANRAVDCLNAYMTEPGDEHAAFIHHGSMVPVQHYLFLELWNRSQSEEQLHYFYPRLRQYYLFFAGHAEGSTTGKLRSQLLKTWDYFYNSGGWDDYPPQVHVHRHQLQEQIAPVITTSQAIRIAKILRMAAAGIGGLEEDIRGYDADIARFSHALEQAWDEASGYYGYVVHDERGEAVGLLRHESGENYNRGLDGLYPLVAGVLPSDRFPRIMRQLTDPRHIWSPIGLSTVDQSAPYFSREGYWNGAVWMPHQWFFWKTMLDYGQADFAWQIAHTALELWRRETALTYHCFEHFLVETGRGAGWHQFGGLSSPVLNWYAAYYRPGIINAGFDVWISQAEFSADKDELKLAFLHTGASGADEADVFTILVCMRPGDYRVTCNETEVHVQERMKGTLELQLKRGQSAYQVRIQPVGG